MVASAHDVARAVIDRLGPVDTMRLQKLVYYVQAWHLAREGEAAFPERIEAWRDGPVVRDLFRTHRRQYLARDWPAGNVENIDPDLQKTISWVLGRYGRMTGDQLSRITHAEGPWIAARGAIPSGQASSELISVPSMRHYYARQVESPQGAVGHAVANAALEGQSVDAKWRETLTAVAEGRRTPEDVLAEELRRYSDV